MRKVHSGDVYFDPRDGQVLLYFKNSADSSWHFLNMKKVDAFDEVAADYLPRNLDDDPTNAREIFLFNVNDLDYTKLVEEE